MILGYTHTSTLAAVTRCGMCRLIRSKKASFFKTALPCTVLCAVIYFGWNGRGASRSSATDAHLSGTRKAFRILIWHSFGKDFFNRIFGDDVVAKCAFPCKFTQDRKQLDDSHVVVLQSFFNTFWKSLPPRRRPGQAWLLYAMEPPYRLPANASKLDTLGINWTLSYRFDADVVHRYSFKTVRRRRSDQPISAPDPKPKPVAWIVSNCKSFSRREQFVEELRKTVPVDIYGGCGANRCRERQFGCYKEIARNYSFYLALENSICKDYSTEKLFHPLLNDMVPVVMGGVDYSAVAPPGSYIDFSSFRTARDLGEYLLELQRSPEAYKRYFRWKNEYEIERPSFSCTVCEQIHGLFSAPVRRPPRSLYKYLWEDAKCTTWKGMLKRKWSHGEGAP